MSQLSFHWKPNNRDHRDIHPTTWEQSPLPRRCHGHWNWKLFGLETSPENSASDLTRATATLPTQGMWESRKGNTHQGITTMLALEAEEDYSENAIRRLYQTQMGSLQPPEAYRNKISSNTASRRKPQSSACAIGPADATDKGQQPPPGESPRPTDSATGCDPSSTLTVRCQPGSAPSSCKCQGTSPARSSSSIPTIRCPSG